MSFHNNNGGRYAVFQSMSSNPVITDDFIRTLRTMDMSIGNVAYVWPVGTDGTTAASNCMIFVAVPTGDGRGYSWTCSIAREIK